MLLPATVLGITFLFNAFCVYHSLILVPSTNNALPLVLTTWPYQDAVRAGYKVLTTAQGQGHNRAVHVDAVEATGHSCEMSQCRHTVGFGGSPDENGETTLDAMIMDGVTHNVGAVGGLRRIKQAISVARKVLDNTDHTLLVGDQAVQFAVQMGFKEESLTTNYSTNLWNNWKQNNCQPNFREGMVPDPKTSCGPYHTTSATTPNTGSLSGRGLSIGEDNHDTIGIVAIDGQGNIASGTSTNGLKFKVPGRVGDSPIPGAGSYADSDIGAAACTGNGDIMMRFLPSYQTVMLMGSGMAPDMAAAQAIASIARKYPTFSGAVVAANKQGQYGAACRNWGNFAITVRNPTVSDATVYNITCVTS